MSHLKELNRTAPRFITQELDRNQCKHERPQKFFQGEYVDILLIVFRLLTMQCKWTFTKRFTLSTPLVCTVWNWILNLLSKMFSSLGLSGMVFLFINFQRSTFPALSTNKSSFKNNQRPKQHGRRKTRYLDTVAKLLQAMKSRIICWQGYRTTY